MNRILRKRRLIAILLLSVLFVLTASTLVLAATQLDPLLNSQSIKYYNTSSPPGYGEKFIAGIISGAVKWLMNIFYIDDPIILVFGKDPRTNKNDNFLANGLYGSLLSTPDQVILGIFPKYFFNAIAILYDGFTKLLPIPIVLFLVATAILYMINTGTPEGRNKIKEYAQAFITAIVSLRFGAYIWSAIISVVHFGVSLIWAYMMKAGVKPAIFMDMIWGGGKAEFNSATQIGSLPLAILLLFAAMMVLALNYQYILRMITLGILILIFPIVTTLSTFPPYRHSLQMWMKEFVSNVSMVLAHALAFGLFFILLTMPGMGQAAAFWLMIAYFAGLPAITGIIRELLGLPGGIGSGPMGAAAGLAGIAALGSISGMLKGRKPEGQHTDSGGSTGSNSDSSSGGGSLTTQPSPRLSGATSFRGKVAHGAYNGVSAVLGNKGIQKAGRLTLGAAAATTGAVLSGMTGGSPAIGLAEGVRAGSILSKGTGKIANGLGSGAQTVAQAISSSGSMNPEKVFSDITSQSMQRGGVLASANWGLQAAANRISTIRGKEEGYAAPSFVKENKDAIRTAQTSMNELRPQMDLAQAKYEHSLNYFGPDNQKTKDLQEQYQGLKGMYDRHTADANLAQTRLRSPSELQRHTAAFSSSRGRLD